MHVSVCVCVYICVCMCVLSIMYNWISANGTCTWVAKCFTKSDILERVFSYRDYYLKYVKEELKCVVYSKL